MPTSSENGSIEADGAGEAIAPTPSSLHPARAERVAPPTQPTVPIDEFSPLWRAFAAVSFAPARVARATERVSLRRAWLFHFLTALLFLPLLIPFVLWSDQRLPFSPLGAMRVISDFFEEVSREFRRYPWEVTFVIAGIVLGTELAFLGLGLLLAPWGARVERIGSTIANGLRRVWISTPHVLLGALLLMSVAVPLQNARMNYYRARGNAQFTRKPPKLPKNATPADLTRYNRQMLVYNDEMMEFYNRTWRQGRPFYVVYSDELLGGAACVLGAWYLWAVLRAIGSRRDGSQIAQPPSCEFCGYNLIATPMEARCPECGELVVASLGQHVRPGSDWHREPGVRSFIAMALDTARRPRQVGRRLKLYEPGTAHRAFLVINCVLLGLVLPPMFWLTVYLFEGSRSFENDPEIWPVGIFFGVGIASGLFVLSHVWAGLVGLFFWSKARRNLLPAGMQSACFASSFFAYAVVVTWLTTAILVSHHKVFLSLARGLRMPTEGIAVFIGLSIGAVAGLWHLSLIVRCTAGARFANR